VNLAICPHCGTQIVWARTPRGRACPLEVTLRQVMTEGGLIVRGRESHFAYCSKADELRKSQPPAGTALPDAPAAVPGAGRVGRKA